MRLYIVSLIIKIIMITDIMNMNSIHRREIWRSLYNMNLMTQLHQFTGNVHGINPLAAAVGITSISKKADFHILLLYSLITSL